MVSYPAAVCVVAPDTYSVTEYAARVAHQWRKDEPNIRTALVDGDSGYVPGLDAFDNVMLGSRSSMKAALFRSDARAVELATTLGIGSLDYHPTSPEERHALCIARGLRQNPDLLVLASPLNRYRTSTAAAVRRLVDERTAAGARTLYTVDEIEATFSHADHVVIVRGQETLFDGKPTDISNRRARLLACGSHRVARSLAETQLRADLPACRTDEDVAEAVLRIVRDVVGNRSVMVVLNGELPTVRSAAGTDPSLVGAATSRRFVSKRLDPAHDPNAGDPNADRPSDGVTVLELGGDLGRIVMFDDGDEYVAFDIDALLPNLETLVLARLSEVRAVQAARYINRAESVRTLVGGIAHDFNNSLQSLFGLIEVIDQANENVALDDKLNTLRVVATDAASFVSKLVAFARTSDFTIEPVDVHELLRDAVDMVRLGVDLDIKFSLDLQATNSVILGDAPELRNVFVNLLLNACQAVPHTDGRVDISTIDHQQRGELSIRITDDGCGVSDKALAHIFEPFVTTKGPSLGTGMGLAIAFGTIEEHDGSISIEDTSPQGTTVLVQLNSLDEEIAGPVAALPASPNGRNDDGVRHRVLICDDEMLVLTVLSEMVALGGYDVLTAASGEECLDIYRNRGSEVAVVLIDQLMPNMHGDEVIRQLQAMNPGVIVIWASGYRYIDEHVETMPKVFAHMRKPIDLHELQAMLAEATAAYEQQLRAADRPQPSGSALDSMR